jgi:hypothetical protein
VKFQVYSQDKVHGISRNTEQFQFSAELESPYTFQPPVLEGGYVLSGHSRQSHGTLKLVQKEYPRWKPGTPEVTPGPFQAAVTALATPGLYDVQLTIPENAAPGSYNGTIHIAGAGAKSAAFDYPFMASVGSVWTVMPAFLDLGVLDSARLKDWRDSTQIRQVYGHPFKVARIEGLPSWLHYDFGKDSVGNFIIQWRVDAGALKQSTDKGLEGQLKIVTDSKEEGAIILPLKAIWPAIPTPTATLGPKTVIAPKASPTPTLDRKS